MCTVEDGPRSRGVVVAAVEEGKCEVARFVFFTASSLNARKCDEKRIKRGKNWIKNEILLI